MPTTEVVHWNDRPADPESWVYIGRSIGDGYFGNPYASESREDNIRRFRAYFYRRLATSPEFEQEVHGLKGMVLVCHCKPAACHGDVIAEYLDGLH